MEWRKYTENERFKQQNDGRINEENEDEKKKNKKHRRKKERVAIQIGATGRRVERTNKIDVFISFKSFFSSASPLHPFQCSFYIFLIFLKKRRKKKNFNPLILISIYFIIIWVFSGA